MDQFPADPRIPISRKGRVKTPKAMERRSLQSKRGWLSAYSDGMYTGPKDEPSIDKEIRRLGYDPNTLKPAKRGETRLYR